MNIEERRNGPMKKLAALLAALMVLSCGTTVLAANSATAEDLSKEVKAEATTAVDASGAAVKVELKATTPEVKEAAVKEAVAKEKGSQVVALVEVSVPAGTGKVSITFDVPSVKAGDKLYLLHQKADKTWEVIHPDKVVDGKVTATFTSLSPVAIVEVPADTTLPKTGAPVVLPVVALICAAGAVGCAKKVKFN